MKNMVRKALWICTTFVSVGISAASQSSSSSSSSKRSRPEGERVAEQGGKRQQTPASQDKKKVLTIVRDEYVPGERGTVKIQEKVDLFAEDHISKTSFMEHLTEDRKRKLPWIIALITYEREDGSIARDYADGRYWHQYLKSSSTRRHPLYNGPLIGHPAYYAVRVVDNKLTTEYLGTGKEFAANTPQGNLLRWLLQPEPTGMTLVAIGYAYQEKRDLDKAIEFYQQAVEQLRAERKPFGQVLANLGYAYGQKQDWGKAIEFCQQAVELLGAEGETYGYVLNRLGYAYEQTEKFDRAVSFYIQALENDDTFGLINLIYVCGSHNYCVDIPKDKLIEYAQRLLSLPSDDSDVLWYKEKYPERYELAQKEAERLVAG